MRLPRRCRHSCRLRCLIIAPVLLLCSLWLTSQLLPPAGPEDDGFPYEDFAARWNASPHCSGGGAAGPARRIHLMYQSELVPTAFADYVRSWARDYPGFELHFWTDTGIDSFLMGQFGPQMLRFFRNRLAHGVERADVARLLILNHYGGLYVDLDVMSLRSAQNVMKQHDIIFTEEPRPQPHAIFLYSQSSLISNAVVYSSPCHSFWRHYFLRFPAGLQAGHGGQLRLWRRSWQRHLAVFATGPMVLDSIAKSFIASSSPDSSKILVASPELFQPGFDAESPGLARLRWQCRLPLLRHLLLSRLQLRHCDRFLQQPGSFVNKSVTAFARHDFLHLGYHHKAKAAVVRVDELLPGVVLH